MKVMQKAVNVAITSDLICPWCWVGLRKLQEASKRTGIDTVITWKPFLLRPNLPEEGVLKTDPTPESRVSKRLKAAGEEVGINFTGLTDRTPNTVEFHAVMKMLQDELKMDPKQVTSFHEAVFEGYFTLGILPDQDGIMKAAHKVQTSGFADVIEKLFQDVEKLSSLKRQAIAEAQEASMKGISGVPFFEFNDEPAFSGAQPVEIFSSTLEKYAE